MKSLKDILDEATVAELRALSERGAFPGISFKHLLEFLLSDGIMPASGLPLSSFLALEDWARARLGASRTV